jgi:hypothetical protein
MAQQTSVSACSAHEENLVLFHYGDLAGDERSAIATHIAGCIGCAAYLSELSVLLPLTEKNDEPPQQFWMDYNRELRHKIDAASETPAWWRNLALVFRPRMIAAMGATAVVVLALTFTLGRNFWSAKDNPRDDDEAAEMLPVAENLDFYSAMDVLDDLDVLELMGNQSGNPA